MTVMAFSSSFLRKRGQRGTISDLAPPAAPVWLPARPTLAHAYATWKYRICLFLYASRLRSPSRLGGSWRMLKSFKIINALADLSRGLARAYAYAHGIPARVNA